MEYSLPATTQNLLDRQSLLLASLQTGLQKGQKQFILTEENKLKVKDSFFKLSSPEYILSKGYSITMKAGKAVKSSEALIPGDIVETVLFEGRVSSVVVA